MKKGVGLNFAEIGLLFAALFLLMPYVPSHEPYHHEAMPWVAFAAMAFAASRAIRWGKNWVAVVLETAVFGLFAWILFATYNLI